MTLQENEFAQLVHLNPRGVRCQCRKSPLVPNFPDIHCPSCHETYTARTDHYPARCGPCGFNLRRWRRLNGISDKPEFLKPTPASA